MEDRLRICLVSLMFSPSIGGTQARMEKQARQLHALGHEVTVITLRLDKRWKQVEVLDGLQVMRVGGIYRRSGLLRIGRIGYLPASIAMFLKLWQLRHTYDAIHAFEVSPIAAVAAFIGKITKKPVVISVQNTGPDEVQRKQLERSATLMKDTLHNTHFLSVDFKTWVSGNILYLHKSAIGGSIILNFLRRSDAIYQILSTRSRSFLTSQGFRAEQIVHIPGSVDVNKFSPVPQNRIDQTRPERIIICVARLEYSKGIDILLHAWKRLMHTSTNWQAHLKPRLRLVGDGALREQLERMAVELDIQESVEFLGTRTDVIDLLQQSWGFVLPSLWEGMPNALLEAMACGLPCVATCVSGSEDIISDGVNGLLVEPMHPEEMSVALRRIIEDEDLARRLGDEARAHVVRNYQLSHVVEQCLELYRCVLKRGSNGWDGAVQLQEAPLQMTEAQRGL
jgi:glycosyltransferase involved in cell wall biosynthesis